MKFTLSFLLLLACTHHHHNGLKNTSSKDRAIASAPVDKNGRKLGVEEVPTSEGPATLEIIELLRLPVVKSFF